MELTMDPPKDVVVMEMWTVQLYHKGIRVEGHRQGDVPDQFWHSSLITKRISNYLVQSCTGRVYQLEGPMDKNAMLEQGDSTFLMKKFEKGFPINWKMCMKSDADVPVTDTEITDSSKPVSKILKAAKFKPKTKEKKPMPSLNNTLLSMSGVSEAGTEDDPLLVNKLPKSRSGRVIIPRLSYWTGQRVMVRPQTQFVDVIAGTPNALRGEQTLAIKSDSKLQQRENRATQNVIRMHMSKKKNYLKKNPRNYSSDTSIELKVMEIKSNISENEDTHISDPAVHSCTSMDLGKPLDSTLDEYRVISDKEKTDCISTETGSKSKKTRLTSDVAQSDSGPKLGESTDGTTNLITQPGLSVNTNSGDVEDLEIQPRTRSPTRKARKHRKKSVELSTKTNVGVENDDAHVSKEASMDKKAINDMPKRRHSDRVRSAPDKYIPDQSSRSPIKHKTEIMAGKLKKLSDSVETTGIMAGNVKKQSTSLETTGIMTGKVKQPSTSTETTSKNDAIRGKKRRRTSKTIKSSSESETEELPPRKRRKHKTMVSSHREKVDCLGSDDSWSDGELGRFKKACQIIPLSAPSYWNQVSAMVRTKSEEQCKMIHFKDAPENFSRKRTKSKSHDPVLKPSQLTGGIGTLKRKRQIRELIVNNTKDCGDDVYNSTPYRGVQTIKIPKLSSPSMPSTMDEFRTPGTTKTQSNRQRKNSKNQDCFQTPCQRPHLSMPVSEKKTPFSALLSPSFTESYDRDNVDGYVHRIKKKSRGKQWGVLPPKTKSRHSDNHQTQDVTKGRSQDLFEDDEVGHEHDNDYDSDSVDYYFSDYA